MRNEIDPRLAKPGIPVEKPQRREFPTFPSPVPERGIPLPEPIRPAIPERIPVRTTPHEPLPVPLRR